MANLNDIERQVLDWCSPHGMKQWWAVMVSGLPHYAFCFVAVPGRQNMPYMTRDGHTSQTTQTISVVGNVVTIAGFGQVFPLCGADAPVSEVTLKMSLFNRKQDEAF